MTYTIDDPFTDAPNEWTLRANTELTNVRWTVTVLRAGTPIQDGETTYGAQSFNQTLNVDNNGDQVQIELVGTVPEVDAYSYEPRQTFVVASLGQRAGENTKELQNDSVYYYTAESQEARQSIRDAQDEIDAAGGDQDAEGLVDSAISSYENENFENAINLSNQAKSQAKSAQQSRQTTQTILYAVGGIVVLGLLAAGGYYVLSNRGDDYSKL